MDGDDLRLSLSLGMAEIDQRDAMHPCVAGTRAAAETETKSNARGIDVNLTTAPGRCGDGNDLSSSSPRNAKRRSVEREENGGGKTGGGGGSDEEEGEATRKKLRLSKEQSAILEESFKEHNTLNPKQKLALAKRLNLRPRQVEVWFQNRRARQITKLKQTEVDCEFLKRCCENLTEENRRLQRELLELRALKRSPHFYMPAPATTLTMCPSCERVEASENQAKPFLPRRQIRS
ncbi:hypothetical protein ACLOJK_011677 [Asimina triloba]